MAIRRVFGTTKIKTMGRWFKVESTYRCPNRNTIVYRVRTESGELVDVLPVDVQDKDGMVIHKPGLYSAA